MSGLSSQGAVAYEPFQPGLSFWEIEHSEKVELDCESLSCLAHVWGLHLLLNDYNVPVPVMQDV